MCECESRLAKRMNYASCRHSKYGMWHVACDSNRIYTQEMFSFCVQSGASTFNLYATSTTQVAAARISARASFSLSLIVKGLWRFKYLIYSIVRHTPLCISISLYKRWPGGPVKWPRADKMAAVPTHLTPDRAKRGPFPQMSFCQAERNVRNKF